MSKLFFGLSAGLAFGVTDVLLMIPLQLPNKRVAMTAAFFSRFSIGFLIPLVQLPIHGALKGALIALLISLSDAIVTKAYIPIIAVGVIGGAIIGWAAGKWAV